MSPRRMDISSLLRNPTPPPNPSPASLLHILNDADSLQHPPRPPFGFDALVHVASEEHRRIAAVPDRLPQRDLPSLVHDHDRPPGPSLHHTPLYHLPTFYQDRRALPSSPPSSPSPEPSFPLVSNHGQFTSPRARQHLSASPTNSYPTLRQQPTCTTPALVVNDACTIAHPPSLSLQHPPPFLRSPHPPLLSHSSPRNGSPHRHSPQHIRSQHHSPLIHTRPLVPPPAEADIMSPRYSCGPKMAGGIEILSNNPSPLREPPKPDFPNYHSPNISPLSARAFPLNDDGHQTIPPSRRLEGQEMDTVFLRERERPRPPHLSSGDLTTNITKNMCVPLTDDIPSHPLERHPIRVWEDHPTACEAPRRVAPAAIPGIISSPVQACSWSAASASGHSVRPTMEVRATVFPQDLTENVPMPPLSTCKELPPPPCHQPPEPLLSVSRTLVEGTCLDRQSSLPTPVEPEPQAYLSQTSPPNSLTVSPVLDLHLENSEIQSEPLPERSETQLDANVGVPPTPSAEPMHVDTDANLALRQPSPEVVRPVPTSEPDSFEMSSQPTHASVSQNPKSPAGQPIQRESAFCRFLDLGHTTGREQPVSEQVMMDMDEELLSLVEDRPVRTEASMPKAQIDSELPPLITVSQATNLDTGRPSGETPDGLPLVSFSQPILKGPPMTDEEKIRASMPPPTARSRKTEKEKTTSAAAGSKKKKDGTSKPVARAKPPPKPRAKPVPKSKAKPNTVDLSSKAAIPKSVINADIRSRSTSVIPGPVDGVVPEAEADDSDKEDDKLYCVCKTRYDEDRMMIACDRCDEWFHTLCVSMPDLEIDLVDQFICPPCMQRHPDLRTTWKRRCLFGLEHENPSSPEACHKPSRGAFSKYCSDDCGVKYMQTRILEWEKSGGVRDLLWESVKNAPKREGVVCVVSNGAGPRTVNADSTTSHLKLLDSAAKRRAEREVARLNLRLEEVVKEREFMKRELEMVTWREKVVELASERAGKVDECGWDQRLCFGEEEWADFGSEVLESYEEERVKAEPGDDAMPLDISAMHGEWWCTGKKKCERHGGWQKLRAAEVSFDKETKEGILLKHTTREREIRKCIEDILYQQPTGTLHTSPHPEVQLNGPEKLRSTGHISERGKKGRRSCV